MILNPLIFLVAMAIIAAGVMIRLKRHPVIPVITLSGLLVLAIFITCLFIIDGVVLPIEPTKTPPLFWVKMIVWNYDGANLNVLYEAFEVIKWIVVMLLFIAQLLLFVETGLILRHKKERN